jgi:hypothetical protein
MGRFAFGSPADWIRGQSREKESVMDGKNVLHTSRRDFAATVVSGCALCCLGPQHLLAATHNENNSLTTEDKHKFEEERALTHRQLAQRVYRPMVAILEQMEKDIGKEELLKLLKRASHAGAVQMGKKLSRRVPSLQAFARPFKDENSELSKMLVREIVEDSEKVFEVRVTECLVHFAFKEVNALDLGYACICHADFGLPIGIRPKFKLIRSKTLMQGHDCCNHRYVWDA